jgi:hypothetical protein
LKVFHGRHQSGFIFLLLSFRPIQRCLIEPRVDLCEHLTFADEISLLEKNLLELPVDLRTNTHRKRGLHRSESGQIDRQVLP